MAAEHPAPEQEKAPAPARKKHSLSVYLAALFVAVICILLLAWFMEQRTNQEELDELQQQAGSAVERLEQLQSSHAALTEQVAGLEAQLADTRAQLDQAQRQAEAMSALHRLEQLVDRDRSAARDLLAVMESRGLQELLPDEAAEGERSPRAEFDRIADRLG